MVPWLLLEYLGQVACSLLSYTFCFLRWLFTHALLAPNSISTFLLVAPSMTASSRHTVLQESPTSMFLHISSNHSLAITHYVRNENHLEGNVYLLQQFSESHIVILEESHDTNAASFETGKILTTNRKGSTCSLTLSVVMEFCTSLKWSNKWVTPCINVIGMAVLVTDVVPAGTLLKWKVDITKILIFSHCWMPFSKPYLDNYIFHIQMWHTWKVFQF